MDILIVEDDTSIAQLLKQGLELHGYTCATAGSGEEAMKIIGSEVPSLILLDIMLPKVDGFEIAKRIRKDERTKGIPIIGLTALDIPGTAEKAQKAGMNTVLFKPFNSETLHKKIAEYLKK